MSTTRKVIHVLTWPLHRALWLIAFVLYVMVGIIMWAADTLSGRDITPAARQVVARNPEPETWG